MSKAVYQVRAYNLRHSYDVSDFLEDYRLLLQRTIDEIWKNIQWVERKNKGRRPIPIVPKSNEFKRNLRNALLRDWCYSKHYVDSAIKQAYSTIKSWKRNYLKDRRSRERPIVKRKFARIKGTLYSYKDGKIRVSIRPYEEHLEFDISKAWFISRARGRMGELILRENYLTITYRFRKKYEDAKGRIAWDSNEKSLDGFNPELGWIKIDLSYLFHIHRVYELKRQRLQSLASRKQSLKKILEKYSKRERNRARDFVHKLTTELSRRFSNYVHGFEDLKKENMLIRRKKSTYKGLKKHNRNISKTDWRMIAILMSYKSRVVFLNPKNSSRRCSRCGMVNAPKGALYECKRCGLRIDRQLNAAVNLYLQMEGLTPSPKLFKELMRGWRGFTLTGGEAESPNEPERGLRLMNLKGYVCLLKTT
ncbi:zinc ribbon domain-containing protein [Candidatus Methanodesulfokora washburnensis]|uniref:Transposase n=2 Tax=Candidatus Methanodesulfokora washburnensis TaxID=2478471 RepID=A0A429GIZ3_9CREN|nr:zinc ribbon domain-containing protein [Candidatus Methanodesulfokores washburnensis]RSN73798.1 transposase [Candidatus Methanodesulfokores washburnensis]